MKTVLLGGPGHLCTVEAAAGVQHCDWHESERNLVHRYWRKHGLGNGGNSVHAFFVHQDLSDGEANALIMMYLQTV